MPISSEKFKYTGDVMKDCLPGNTELLELLRQQSFDKERATQILEDIPDINQPILDENGYSTTYLYEAQGANAVQAVHFLLEQGADPNFYAPNLLCDCPLWDLQYRADEETDNAARYEIAKLFFQYGANPNMMRDGESLYDCVVYEVYNHIGDRGWDHRLLFYKLLIAYGGGEDKGIYGKPDISEPIALDKIDDYEVVLRRCEDGYHIRGILLNPDGKEIGRL